jgi:hypothetical protein
MSKIPTAESLYYKTFVGLNIEDNESLIPDLMIEFAKLHVEACKKEISELVNERLKDESIVRAYLVDGSSILKTYPLENIK